MIRQLFISLALVACAAFGAASSFAADPSLHEVYQAAEAGNYRQAQAMMDQVLRDHPRSAKAHFVEAELLAKQGRLANAQAEFNTAEQLQPGLPFAKPTAVQELRDRLANRSASPAVPAGLPAAQSASFPWSLLIVGLLLVAAIIFFIRSRSRAATVIQAPGNAWGGASPQPYPASYGPTPMVGSGMGSGILGGLATGAAVGAGMVAGEALMHRMLDGGHSSSSVPVVPDSYAGDNSAQYDLGGNDFGVSDGGSWDDSPDTGGGGDDWS